MTSRSENPGKPENPGTGPILALDAGGHACSAALWQPGGQPGGQPAGRSRAQSGAVLAQETQEISHGQAAALMPMIERVMHRAGVAYTDLARIAVAVGPGGFTGIRVAIATARGLGLAAKVPVIGISSFQAAANVDVKDRAQRRLFVLIDSRREETYFAELDARLDLIGAPRILMPAEVVALIAPAAPALVLGDGAALIDSTAAGKFPDGIAIRPTRVDAVAVAALAADPDRRFDLPPLPVYLRPPDVSKPKETAR
jgi:tRNA threonylcarbamoyladenosine biosynthesis protein TsaB